MAVKKLYLVFNKKTGVVIARDLTYKQAQATKAAQDNPKDYEVFQQLDDDPLDPKVLARRQKDLDGFIDKYQAILDKRADQYAKEILPTWKTAGRRLTAAIDQLYKQYADENGQLDETRLREVERLRWLRLHMANIVWAMEGQEEKIKNNLAYTYSESYYFHAFGLEQAAKVSVVVPIISQAQVMGILANPWLPDDNTYSDRLRANTAYLAAKMREAIEEAVTTGASVQKTARRIQDIAGEGYFNAVRLARTELNRAASQGSSHLFMQNADILDSKRWNATLDSRTAPKDAANDGKLYDLDYDTPENPGVAGQRIPNHPNCRCKYSPVLAALGVRIKERIARGEGDTPSNFGERIYTQAKDYREYAKERGLPDLDERLRNDDPRRYLRRGETMDAYSKTTAAAILPAAVAAGTVTATATYVDQVNQLLAQGITTEVQAREVGAILRDEIESQVVAAEVGLKQQFDEINALMDTYLAETDNETKKAIMLDLEEREKKYLAAKGSYGNLRAEKAREVLSQIRPLGPKTPQRWAKGSSKETRAAFELITQYLPTDWLEISSLSEMKAKKVSRGYYRQTWRGNPAEYALSGKTPERMKRVAIHEMGHRFEDQITGIQKLEYEFYKRRTAGESLQWLGAGYAKSEKTRFDDFLSPYMGKDYGNTESSYYELLSMGLESLFAGSYDLTKDPDFYDFILGVLVSR